MGRTAANSVLSQSRRFSGLQQVIAVDSLLSRLHPASSFNLQLIFLGCWQEASSHYRFLRHLRRGGEGGKIISWTWIASKYKGPRRDMAKGFTGYATTGQWWYPLDPATWCIAGCFLFVLVILHSYQRNMIDQKRDIEAGQTVHSQVCV